MNQTTPKEIAEAANISLQTVEALVGYAHELEVLFAKVISMPRRALLDLEELLDELAESVTAVDTATKIFFKAIEDPAEFIDEGLVHDMSSSRLPKLVEDQRGHCHEIGNIYYRYLSGVLSNLFKDQADISKVDEILTRLENADDDMFKELTRAVEKMQELAKKAYRLKILGKRSEAIDLVQNAAPTLLDMREKFNDALVEMTRIKSDFIKATRVAPA